MTSDKLKKKKRALYLVYSLMPLAEAIFSEDKAKALKSNS